MEDFCRVCNYIDITFPQRDIKAFFTSEKSYSDMFLKLTDEVRNNLSTEQLEEYRSKVSGLISNLKANDINNSGIIGEWRKILHKSLLSLKEWLSKKSTKSINTDLNDKLRLYLLQLLFGTSLDGETNKATLRNIYAAVLASTPLNVKTDIERLDEGNLGYKKNYGLRVRSAKKIYHLIDSLKDETRDKKRILSRIVEDLIPREDNLKKSLQLINDTKFMDINLERMVRKATEDYHSKLSENP